MREGVGSISAVSLFLRRLSGSVSRRNMRRLLGLVNIDLDPNGQMNVWLSSAANHQWNPNQPAPATPWEAEIDRLMRKQAATVDDAKRKPLFDRVQQIVS